MSPVGESGDTVDHYIEPLLASHLLIPAPLSYGRDIKLAICRTLTSSTRAGEVIYLTPREKSGVNFIATFCSRGAWSSEKCPPDLVRKCVDETQTPGVQLLFHVPAARAVGCHSERHHPKQMCYSKSNMCTVSYSYCLDTDIGVMVAFTPRRPGWYGDFYVSLDLSWGGPGRRFNRS